MEEMKDSEKNLKELSVCVQSTRGLLWKADLLVLNVRTMKGILLFIHKALWLYDTKERTYFCHVYRSH